MRLRQTSSDAAHTPRIYFARWFLVPSFLALLALTACGGSADQYSPAVADDEPVKAATPLPVAVGEAAVSEGGVAAGTCTTGDARECKVMLGRHGDVVNCFVGMQLCEDDAWGPCQSAPKL